MSDVVLIDRLGDITFGLPPDLAPHRKPWAYYDMLGVEQTSSSDDIKKAARKLAIENHPDKFALADETVRARAEERFKVVSEISDILLDEGEELGAAYGRRRQYDEISRYGEFFGAVHIEHQSARTVTVAENMLDLLTLKRRHREAEHEFFQRNPDVAALIEKVKTAAQSGLGYQAQKYHNQIIAILAEKEGISVADFIKKQEEAIAESEKKKSEQRAETRVHEDSLMRELKEGAKAQKQSADEPLPIDRVYDIWYNGEKGKYQTVTFATGDYTHLDIVGIETSEHVVKLGLKGTNNIPGMRKVHFKAAYADVTIKDAHLEGIIQLVEGKVDINYEGSSYGAVIRVRAPRVNALSGFVQSGDLYIPTAFATDGWDKRTPHLDVAVMEGSVSLSIKTPTLQTPSSSRNAGYGYGGGFIKENTHIISILNENNHIKYNKY